MANSILDMAKELRELGETNRSMVFKLNIGKIYGIDLILEAKGATELDAYNLRLAEKFLKSKMEILQMKNPNEIKSQDDVTVNQGGRRSDVLLATIKKCEILEYKLNIAKNALKFYSVPLLGISTLYNFAEHHKKAIEALNEIEEYDDKSI